MARFFLKSLCSFKVFQKPLPLAWAFCLALPHIVFAQKSDVASTVQQFKKLSLEDLVEMEVTSVSNVPEKLRAAPSAIQVITQERIRQSGATNVAEALRLATNLQVAQVNSSQWAVSARGFNNVLANKLLVLIDGRVVYTPMYAGIFWDVQNLLLENIDRIEVISGPGGTLWGANAVNGVINIITKSADETTGVYAEAAAGTELRSLGSLRYGGEIGKKIFYRIDGTAFKRDNTIFPDSTTANDSWHAGQASLRMDWAATEKDHVTLQASFYEARPDPDGGKPVEADGNNVLGRWVHSSSDRSQFRLQWYYDQTARDFRNGFAEDLKTYDVEGQHRFKWRSRQELVYGLGIRFLDHEVRNLELFSFLPAEKSLYLFNIFLQDQLTVVPEKLKITAGIKIENYTYSGFQYQPNLRINWTLKPNVTLWSAVSRAVRNPSRLDREFFLSISPQLPFIVGNAAKPEDVISWELGLRLQPRNSLSLNIATFFNQYDNLRGVGPRDPDASLPVSFINSVRGDTYGAEFSFSYAITKWWRLHGGYTFLKKELSVKQGLIDLNNASAESNDPTHQALLQSQLSFSDKFEFGTVIRYVGQLPEPEVSEYVGLDLRISWRFLTNFDLSIVGQNLMQDSHTEFIPASPAPKSIERSAYVKLACQF